MTQDMECVEHEGGIATGRPAGGKYLTFRLGDEEYGLGILGVQEIIGMMPVTEVPKTPDFVRGVVNLRGKVIPVVDLRLTFGMERREDTERTCIIVVQIAGADRKTTTGLLVDEVTEVLDVAEEQVEAPPEFGANADTSFIHGMARIADTVVMLLDIDKVLSEREAAFVHESPQQDQSSFETTTRET